jgi:sugar lactone lactonase YvrE
MPAGSAGYWRIDHDGLTQVVGDITIANGLAFSPAGDVMYIADSPTDRITAFDYDLETGTPSNRRTFAATPCGGFPDGGTVDADGGYWSALFNGDCIVRFDRDGRLDRTLRSPVPQPTMVAFGGPELDTLYLTTARRFLPEDERQAFPLAGGIFACRVDVTGVPEPHVRFGAPPGGHRGTPPEA